MSATVTSISARHHDQRGQEPPADDRERHPLSAARSRSPEGSGPSVGSGPSEGSGRSESSGQPEDSGQPEGSGQPEDSRSPEELEIQICDLASQIAQQTCRFLELLAAFDQAGGWHDRGFVSASQWLSWRCGMTRTTAREHMRVARSLPRLPLITAQFRSGHLSYSKVRALTRVATAETEPELVNIARGASASQLDRFISGLRSAGVLDDVEAAHRRRQVTWRVEEDGHVHLSARLSPEDGAVVIDALRAAQEYLQATATGSDPEADLESGRSPSPDGPDDDRSGTVPEEDEQRTLADALVQICTEGPPTGAEPAHGSRRAETVVHATIEQLAQLGPAGPRTGSPRLELGPALHPETARRLTCDTGVVLHLHDDDPTYTVVPSTHPGRTIDVGRRTRTPNAALMRALWDRDQGCRYPACGRRRFIHAHHVDHWAHGGPTELDNLVLLCGQHHRLLHEGGYSMSMRDGRVLVVTSDGVPVPQSGEPPVIAPPDPIEPDGGFVASSEPFALSPVNGGPMDLKWAVSVVADRWEASARATGCDPAAGDDSTAAPGPDAA